MVLLFIGPSGSGKDTQADMLEERYGFEVVSTGELLRQITDGESKMQEVIKEGMNKGFLPDNLVYGLLEMYLSGSKTKHYILTGVVRRESQVEKLDNALLNVGKKLNRVVYFNLSDEEAVKRLGGRRVCEKCGTNYHIDYKPPRVEGKCDLCGADLFTRDDDNPEAIKKRLHAFHLENTEILDNYRDRNLLTTVDASQTIKEIHKDLVSMLALK